jgi:hypothetical protein
MPNIVRAFSQEKDGIKIQVKDFINDPYVPVIINPKWTITAEDLQKNRFIPLKIKITNTTDKSIYISNRSAKLAQATSIDIASKFKKREVLPPFLFSCVNGLTGIGFFINMLYQEGLNFLLATERLQKNGKLIQGKTIFYKMICLMK